MSNWLKALMLSFKWWVATDEMAELQNMRFALRSAKRSMQGFPDAIDALTFVENSGRTPLYMNKRNLDLTVMGMLDRRHNFLKKVFAFRANDANQR